MRPRSRIQTTGPNNGHQLRDYSKSSNRSENRPLILCETTKLLRDFSLFLLLFRVFVLPLQLKVAKLLTLGYRCKHHCTRLIAVLHT